MSPMRSHHRGILNAGIGGLAFVLACAGLNRLLSAPGIDRMAPNVAFFREHRDEFDTLFIGSSHVRHQIAPRVFDRTMREAGNPTRAFNLGLNGMIPPENFYVVDEILRIKPRNLKWVFIELGDLETKPFPGTDRTLRALYWHDWKCTTLVLRAILEAGPDDGAAALARRLGDLFVAGRNASEKRHLLFFHSVLFAKNFANVGRRSDLARWIRQSRKNEGASKDIGPNGDGFTPLNKKMTATQEMGEKADLSRGSEVEARFVSALTASAYRQLADDVRHSGAVPIFLVTPDLAQTRLGFPPESGVDAAVMSFNNVRAYPQLYRNEVRVDPDHLDAVGSEQFTQLLAEDFVERIRQNQIR